MLRAPHAVDAMLSPYLRSCVRSMAWSFQAIDATLSPCEAIAAHGSKNKTPRQYGNSPIFARGMPIFSTNLSAMAEFGTATTSHPP